MLCEACRKPDSQRCAACLAVGYCSKACQKAHWPEHKFTCRPDAVTLADHLVHAVRRGVFPTYLPSRLAFGFCSVDLGEQFDLIAFYNHLLDDRSVTSKMLDRWTSEGLLAGIQQTVAIGPWTAERIRWLIWVQQRESIWPDDPVTRHAFAADDTWDFVCRRTPRLRHVSQDDFLQGHLEIRIGGLINGLQSLTGRCYTLYLAFRSQQAPSSSDASWLIFGFAAFSRSGEDDLEGAYYALIDRCSFDDFCDAAEHSQLLSLFQKHGILRDPDTALVDILSGSPRTFKAVWHLKQYVATSTTPGANMVGILKFDPHKASLAVFGFKPEHSAEETHQLQRLYGQVLLHAAARPLELQAAMERGRIADYVLHLPYLAKLSKGEMNLLKRLPKRARAP